MALTRPSTSTRGASRRSAGASRWQRLWYGDWLLWAAVLSLSALGVLLVAAATKPLNSTHPFSLAKHQLVFLAVGVVLAVVAAVINYRAIRASAPVVYLLALLGLVATFVVGVEVNGSRAWLSLGGGLTIEPSEFAKLAVIVLSALIVNARAAQRTGIGDLDVAALLGLFAVPSGLVLLQRDLGTVLVIVVIFFGVLAVGGAAARWLTGLTALTILAAVLVVKLHLLHGYQQARLTAFLHPESGTQTYAYNAIQARIAIGSGGLHGTGLFHGPQINNGYVFAAHTDFIFATAGEELGFIGAGLIIVLLGVILWRGLRIAAHAPDLFGRVTAAGIVCWLAFESFENIGMNLGIMPITGIPLQFVSYGGSSLFASMLAIGLLQNIAIQTKIAARIARE